MDPAIINKILEIIVPYKPKSIAVFGSYARGDHNENSDIDIAVDYRRGITLFDICDMLHDLKEALGVKVDLVDIRGAKPYFLKNIEADLKFIYESQETV